MRVVEDVFAVLGTMKGYAGWCGLWATCEQVGCAPGAYGAECVAETFVGAHAMSVEDEIGLLEVAGVGCDWDWRYLYLPLCYTASRTFGQETGIITASSVRRDHVGLSQGGC